MVAIKVFRPELAETLGADRFAREIKTAANLQHPHILTVHDSGVADGLAYYVMPYIEGESLRTRIDREGELPVPDVVRILREVADALSHAHGQGVIHRDIKPDNVLMSGRHALVADFGVAKAISAASGRQSVTTMGVALGTPGYMAPEQAAADPSLDHRVDIYALGVLGYELLTGEPPFARRNAQQVIAAHMTEAAPRVSVRRASVPAALDTLIARCLEKAPADRYQSASELVSELETISTPTVGITPVTSALAANRRTNSALLWSGIALATVAVALVLWTNRSKFAGTGATDPNVVAVLPFEFSAAPDVSYLREGIVNILETSLTGEGGPRAVASQTSIAQWKRNGGDKGLTDDDGRRIARELGAGFVIRGNFVGPAANLIVTATLTPSAAGGHTIEARETGPADSIASIASKLANQLLTLRSGAGADRAASLERVPPAALRAYLEAQQAFRSASYSDAVDGFARALGLDSTFALAALGHSLATGFSISTWGTSEGASIAFRNRATLSPRDLLLLQMWSPARFAGHELTGREIVRLRERLVQQIPDQPEAWYLVGDSYLHYGEAYGFSREESLSRADNAFRRALALDPGIEYLRAHLVDPLLWDGDDATYIRMVDSLHVSLPYHQITRAIITGDSAAERRIVGRLDSLSTNELIFTGMYAVTAGDPSVATIAFQKAFKRPMTALERRGTLWVYRSMSEASGRAKDAMRAREELRAMEDHGTPAFPAEDIFDGLLGSGVDTAAANRAYAYLDRSIPWSAPRSQVREGPFVVGLWAARRGDGAKANAIIKYFDALAGARDTTGDAATSRLYGDVLRVVIASAHPPRELLMRADSMLQDGPTTANPRFAMNLIIARAWERLGETQRAAASIKRLSVKGGVFTMTATGMRDQGRILLAVGDTSEALRVWRTYLRPRGLADPDIKKADDDIRSQVARIERGKR